MWRAVPVVGEGRRHLGETVAGGVGREGGHLW